MRCSASFPVFQAEERPKNTTKNLGTRVSLVKVRSPDPFRAQEPRSQKHRRQDYLPFMAPTHDATTIFIAREAKSQETRHFQSESCAYKFRVQRLGAWISGGGGGTLIVIHLQCWEVLQFFCVQRQRCLAFLGTGFYTRRHPGLILADVQGQKLRSGPPNLGKKQVLCADIHDSQNSFQEAILARFWSWVCFFCNVQMDAAVWRTDCRAPKSLSSAQAAPLESACSVSTLWDAVTVPAVCFSGALWGSSERVSSSLRPKPSASICSV